MVYNPVSGAGRAAVAARELLDGLASEFGRGAIGVRLVATERAPTADWLRSALAESDALAVVGGDGAVRLAAPEAARAGVPLWHAPLGTENLFARSFGMTRGAAPLARALASMRLREIDLGTVDAAAGGSARFAIMASVGFDADVVHALATMRSGGITHWSYARPILRTALRWQPPAIEWSVDGRRESLGRGIVVVANLREYGVRLNPAANAVPDDGLLDAVFLPASGALAVAAWVPYLRAGRHLTCRGVRQQRGSRIELLLDRPAPLQIDGDPFEGAATAGLYSLGIGPERLKVLLPSG